MSEFRKAIAEFRADVRQEGERSKSPGFQAILERGRPARILHLRWAVAAGFALLLAAVPLYRSAQQREAEQAREDTLLLEQVNRALAQSVPRAMAVLAVEFEEESR